MNTISNISVGSENVTSGAYMYSVEKKTEMCEEMFSENCSRSETDCFEELCKKFPLAAFVVENNSFEIAEKGWLPESFLNNSKLENFSELGTLSIAFDIKIFEKAAKDSEFMENLVNFVEHLNKEWDSKAAQCLDDGMKNMFVEMYLKEDGTIGYTTGEYPDKFDLYGKQKNNLFELQNDNITKRILEEYEKQRQEGLFAMMDKIYENSKELRVQIEKDIYEKGMKMEKYEKTFLFLNEN